MKLKPLDFKPVPVARQNLHGFMRFPGSFHPPLVNWLIRNHSNVDWIGDPLCGAGSVAVEGIAEGLNVLSMDIDPVSCLLTTVKSNPVDPKRVMTLVKKWINGIGPTLKPDEVSCEMALVHLDQLEEKTNYARPKNVFHWFDPYVVSTLCRAFLSILNLDCTEESRKILEAIVAATIRRVSRADLQPVSGLEVTKVMKKRLVDGLTFDVVHELRQRSKLLIRGYEGLSSYDCGTSVVVQGDSIIDWKTLCEEKKIELDLIITSPPYCSAIEYWRRHRLEYFWLGFMDNKEIRELSRRFIGSTTILRKDLEDSASATSQKAKIVVDKLLSKGKIKKALTVRKYFSDLEKWIADTLSTLSPNGTAYIVLGPSKSYGVRIGTPDIFAEIIRNFGYDVRTKVRYSIINRRMQYPTRNNSAIKTESILEVGVK